MRRLQENGRPEKEKTMNKQKLAIFLTALLLLVAAFVSSALAQSYPAGEVAEVTFTVTANPDRAVAATLKLVYDHSVFELVPSAAAATDTVVLMDMNGIAEGSEITLSFRIHPTAPDGEYRIRMDLETAGDLEENTVNSLTVAPVKVAIGSAAPEPTEEPTPEPTPVPTPEPTPEREFYIKPLEFNGADVTIRWVDSENRGPYRLKAMYIGGTAVQDDSWIMGDEELSTTSEKQFVCFGLYGGYRYRITVLDGDDNAATLDVEAPDQGMYKKNGVVASSVKVTIGPRYYNAKGTVMITKALIASDIEKYIREGTRFYGLRIEREMPAMSGSITPNEVFVFLSPNGFMSTYIYSDRNFPTFGSQETWFIYCLGDSFFSKMYELNGSIPTGEYTLQIYWDGMLLNEQTFTVE